MQLSIDKNLKYTIFLSIHEHIAIFLTDWIDKTIYNKVPAHALTYKHNDAAIPTAFWN